MDYKFVVMKDKVNDGHYHEMMDRIHISMETINDHMVQHPVSRKHKKINRLLIEAIVVLNEAYQETGKQSYKKPKKQSS